MSNHLDGIKVGDAVYVDSGRYGRTLLRTGVVKKTTPSGQIVADFSGKEVRFNKNGRCLGNGAWDRTHLISKDQYDAWLPRFREQSSRAALDRHVYGFNKGWPKSKMIEFAKKLAELVDAMPDDVEG